MWILDWISYRWSIQGVWWKVGQIAELGETWYHEEKICIWYYYVLALALDQKICSIEWRKTMTKFRGLVSFWAQWPPWSNYHRYHEGTKVYGDTLVPMVTMTTLKILWTMAPIEIPTLVANGGSMKVYLKIVNCLQFFHKFFFQIFAALS